MDRQEGYYWVKFKDDDEIDQYKHQIAEWNYDNSWLVTGFNGSYQDSDFEHINENRIKEPGELPD